jgi:hypothetical protein
MQWMDINKILTELRTERDYLVEAIAVLKRWPWDGETTGQTIGLDGGGVAINREM